MNIIKRSGMEVVFNAIKIEDAVRKANKSVQESDSAMSRSALSLKM